MAFITAATRSNIVELAMGMLNQAPSTTLLNTLIEKSTAGSSLQDLADYIATTDAFVAEYPSTQTAKEFATEMFGKLITGGTITAEINTAVIDLLEGLLTTGTTKAEGFVAVINYLKDSTNNTNADLGDIAKSFQNRADAAEYFSITKELGGSTDAELAAAIASVTSDAATLTAANTAADTSAAAVEVVAGQTFTLTTGVDTGSSFTGGAGADTYNATAVAAGKATLTSGDSISGGDGTDTLSLTSSIAGTYGAGVIGTSIEALSVTATAATTVDASLMSSVADIYNIGSTTAGTLSVTGAAGIPNVHLNGSNSNTTVGFATANVNGGAADSTTVALASSGTQANTSVTLNGVETINVATSGAMSGKADSVVAGAIVNGTSVTIASDTLTTLAVTGDTGARLIADLAGATTTVTGTITSGAAGDDISFNAGGTDSISVNMGAGNDTVRLQTAPGLLTGSTTAGAQTIVGGDGTDTLVTGVALSKTTNTGVSGFETLRVTGSATVVLDAAKNDISKLIVDGASGGTITGVEAGATLDLTTAGSVTLDKTTTGAIAVNVGNSSLSGAQTSSVTAAGVTSATITNLAIATDTTSARSVGVAGAALTEVTVTGAQPTTITGGGAALAKIDASGISKGVTFSATLKATGAELIGGGGNDTITGSTGADTLTGGDGVDALTGGAGIDVLSGGAGIDTITGGTGKDTMTGGEGADTFIFSANATTATPAVNVSTLSATDTITDFVSGTDKLSGTQAVAFLGNFTNIQAALAANNASGVLALSAAFVTGENNLYVFEAAGSTLSADDLVVNLTGVTSLAAGDFLLGSQGTGNTSALSATAAVVNATTKTNASKESTVKDDTVSGTVAFVEDSTIDGGAGTDTLALSIAATTGTDDGALDADDLDTITNIENITLANRAASTANGNVDYNITLAHEMVDVGDTLTIVSSEDGLNSNGAFATAGVTLSAAEFTSGNVGGAANLHYTGAGAKDVITGGAFNDTIIGGDGDDTLTAGAATGIDNIDGGAGNDNIIFGAVVQAETQVIAGGAGTADVLEFTGAVTADLLNSTVSGIETLQGNNAVANQVVKLTASAASGLTTINMQGGTADDVQFQNSKGVTTATTFDLTSTTISNTEKLTIITAGSTVKGTAAGLSGLTLTGSGAGGGDTFNITGDATFNASGVTATDTLLYTGNTNRAMTIDKDSLFVTSGAGVKTLTGSGTSDLTIADETGDVDVSLGAVALTGFDLITFTTDNTGDELAFDPEDVAGGVTLTGTSTNANLAVINSSTTAGTVTQDLSTVIITASKFDTLAFGKSTASYITNLTVSEKALVTGVASILGTANGTENLTVTTTTATAAISQVAVTTVTNLAKMTLTPGTGANTVTVSSTVGVTNITTVDLSNGGSDTIVINDLVHLAAAETGITITGFTTGIGTGSDVLDIQTDDTSAGQNYIGDYAIVTAAGEAETIVNSTALTIVEVNSAAGTATDLTDAANGGAVETALAAAVGTVTNAGSKGALVVLYGSGASAGDAGVYEVVFTGGADATTANMTVELLGIVSGVAADSFVSGNFA